jgi:activator of HSP90 ATPase
VSKTIRQSVTLKATPHQVYEALMDSRRHSQFTGAKATISREVGGEITTYDGYITGRNLELEPDRRIVQTWRANDWLEGLESQVTFSLTAVPGGTRLSLTHRGVPDGEYESIKQGWIAYYWTPLKVMLAGAG